MDLVRIARREMGTSDSGGAWPDAKMLFRRKNFEKKRIKKLMRVNHEH